MTTTAKQEHASTDRRPASFRVTGEVENPCAVVDIIAEILIESDRIKQNGKQDCVDKKPKSR